MLSYSEICKIRDLVENNPSTNLSKIANKIGIPESVLRYNLHFSKKFPNISFESKINLEALDMNKTIVFSKEKFETPLFTYRNYSFESLTDNTYFILMSDKEKTSLKGKRYPVRQVDNSRSSEKGEIIFIDEKTKFPPKVKIQVLQFLALAYSNYPPLCSRGRVRYSDFSQHLKITSQAVNYIDKKYIKAKERGESKILKGYDINIQPRDDEFYYLAYIINVSSQSRAEKLVIKLIEENDKMNIQLYVDRDLENKNINTIIYFKALPSNEMKFIQADAKKQKEIIQSSGFDFEGKLVLKKNFERSLNEFLEDLKNQLFKN